MACDFRKNKDQIMGEFESYYAKMPFDTGRQQKQLDEWLNEKQYTYSYEKKALVYQAAAELCNEHKSEWISARTRIRRLVYKKNTAYDG